MDSLRQSGPSVLLGRYHQKKPLDNDGVNESSPGRSIGEMASASGMHMLTIAPSKERRHACIIPNLLTYNGSIVVLDPTGEAYLATARRRREMGQTVVRLDPFRVINEDSDSLDPFDRLTGLQGPALESACQNVASLLPGFQSFTDVWENAAFGLVGGVVGYLCAVPEKNKFADLYSTFHADDVVYNLAVVLDTIGKRLPKMAYSEISNFLQKADAERSRVLTSVTSQLKALSSQEAQMACSTSTFSLSDFIDGNPTTIYLMLPPAKITSHFALLRVWIGTLLDALVNRQTTLAPPTLFLIDDCDKLGSFPLLETAITSGKDHSARIWTFWQDLQQLRRIYPGSWLINNSGSTQVFGIRDYSGNAELASMLGVDSEDLKSLTRDEQIVSLNGVSHRIMQLDYKGDPHFDGMYN